MIIIMGYEYIWGTVLEGGISVKGWGKGKCTEE
jgi:hypothetical protein